MLVLHSKPYSLRFYTLTSQPRLLSGTEAGPVIDKARKLTIEETKTDVIKLTPSNKLHVRVAALCERIAGLISQLL